MELYILRHGIAEELDLATSGRDSQRRLTPEGRKKMRGVAKGMQALEIKLDVILSSPFLRAQETAEIVAEVFGMAKDLHLLPALAADGNPKELIDELKEHHRKRGAVLLVGHEPYLSRLISLLISGDTGISITMKKGGLGKLSTKSLQYGRCATLEWLLTPGQIRSVKS